MKTIESRTNPLIKKIVQLHNAKYRKAYQQCIGEGVRVCSTLLQRYHLVMLYVTSEHVQEAQQITSDAHITLVTQPVMEKISTHSTPPGLLGVFELPQTLSLDQLTTPSVALAHIADPGNMGTLIRTAAAMNVPSVVVIEGSDPWSPKVIHATAGTIAYVNIFSSSWDELKQVAQQKKMQLCALVVKDGSSPDAVNWQNALLMVGSEAHGLPAEWLKEVDTKVTLPMPGKTESLNAAVAGSIALYLMVKTPLSKA